LTEITVTPFSDATRDRLLAVSTATLTSQLFKRGLRRTFMTGLAPIRADCARFAGPAFTLRFVPAREDIDTFELLNADDYPQRAAIDAMPEGHVMVMDCRGEMECGAAGDIFVRRLQVRGAAALVVDGAMRDTPEIAGMDFPVHCKGAAAPFVILSHHAVPDFNQVVACGGVAVYPGDILVGDGEGVVVVPSHLAEEVAEAAWEQERMERFIQLKVSAGATLVGTYPPSEAVLAEYRAWVEAGEPATLSR
jgi:regulator of RNase E activity RraA